MERLIKYGKPFYFMRELKMELTDKQEKFAQAIAKGFNQSDAYREAYAAENMSNEAIGVEACRVMNNPKVSLRVKELKERALKRFDITVDDLIAELEEAREVAKLSSQSSAMVSATMGKGKLLGLVTDKQEVKGSMNVTMMPSVKVGGKDLEINIGDDADA
jgi:hypothetical protein